MGGWQRSRGNRKRVAQMIAMACLVVTLTGATASAHVDTSLSDQQSPFGGVGGVAHATAIVGDEIWVGGLFEEAFDRDSSVAEPRTNMARFDYNTGDLRPAVLTADAAVTTIAFDGEATVFLGGAFTSINGVSAPHLVAVNAVSGKVRTTFSSGADGAVHDVVLHDRWLYVAGQFGSWNGQAGTNLIRVDPETGIRDETFDPNPQDKVWNIAIRGDRIYAAGYFEGVGPWEAPIARRWAAGFDLATGAVVEPDMSLPALAPGEREYKEEARATGASTDGTQAFVGDDRNIIRSFDVQTGQQRWAYESEGDIQAIAVTDDQLFVGNHQGWFTQFDGRVLVALDPENGDVLADWTPIFDDGDTDGILSIEQDDQTLVGAGGFATVNGEVTRNLVVFRTSDWAPVDRLRIDGDVDCDGEMSLLDALAIAQYAAGTRAPATCPFADPGAAIDLADADLNGDFTVDDADAQSVLQCLTDTALQPCF